MQMKKVTAHNPTEIACEKKDDKKSEVEMRANVAKAKHKAETEEAKQTDHTHTDNIAGGTDLQAWVLVKLTILLKLAALVDITCDHLKGSRDSE
jgi:hypothetical protein